MYKQHLVEYQDIKLKFVVKILSNIFMCSFAKVFPLLQKLNFVHLWYLLSLPSKSNDIKWSFIIVSKSIIIILNQCKVESFLS
jgi:hypothetical protein